MKILYLCQRVPFPPNRGDKIASYHAIRYLARRHSVSVAALADSHEEVENAAALRAEGIDVTVAKQSPSRARWNAIRVLPGSTPFSVGWYSSSELHAKVHDLVRSAPPDRVVAFSSSMAQYAARAADVPLIADFVDLDSQKWALYGRAHRAPRSWLYREEARRLLAWERAVARRAELVVLRTRAECDDARRLIPGGRFEVVPNGVDLEYFRAPAAKTPTAGVVFTGVMDYFPNVEAVTFFADQVLPRIRRDVPGCTFSIVGARPNPAVRRLAEKPGVTVTGRVPDVRPWLQQALVAVAPLATARGVQNKVLEAMAMATPAVVSSAVARGIDAGPGDGIVIADDPAAVAAEIVALLCNPARAIALGRAGRALVERRYVWDTHLARLESLIVDGISAPASRVALGAAS